MPGQLTKLVYASTLALLVALSYGCKEKYEQKKFPPADTVEVALPVRKDVEVWDSYTARIEGVKSVQIRALILCKKFSFVSCQLFTFVCSELFLL